MAEPRPQVDIRVSSQERYGARWAVSCSTCGSELHQDVDDGDLLRALELAVGHRCA